MEYFMDDSDNEYDDIAVNYNNRINNIIKVPEHFQVKNIENVIIHNNCDDLLSNITNIWEILHFKFNQINRVITYISIDRVKFKASGKRENDAKLKVMKKILQYLSAWTDLSDSEIVKKRYPTIQKILEIRDKFLYNKLNEISDNNITLNKTKSLIYYIQINDRKYYGKGSTIQSAKLEAAAAVFANIPNYYDFDYVEKNDNKLTSKYQTCQNLISTKNGNILSLLYHARNQLKFSTTFISNELFELYNTTVIIDGKPFDGSGRDEIAAKRNAMEKLLIFIQNKKNSCGGSKSMMCTLYRIRSGLIYNNCDKWQRKQRNNTYTSYIKINSDLYTGTGKDEQSANLQAAINVFISPNNFAKDIYNIQTGDDSVRIINKEKSLGNVENHNGKEESKDINTVNTLKNSKPIELTDFDQLPKTLADINPMEILQSQLRTNVSYSIDSNYLQKFKKYKAIAIINNIEYIGYGPCGQIAREEAAKKALLKLCHLTYKHNELSEEFVETIERLIMKKFIELKTKHPENDMISCHRLSAIVMTTDLNLSTAEIVAITSGSHNVYGGLMSMNGTVLYDTHCEILIRRCLLKYFYDQLKVFYTNNKGGDSKKTATIKNNSIFEQSSMKNKKYKLKNNIQFHLYISDAPCGIISDQFKSKHQYDKLTLKYPLDGTNNKLLTNNIGKQQQTWSNIIKGDQLFNMSCSDKISKWNVVGVQGALLSNIIEPVYFYSIILGKSKHLIDIYRTTIGRFANLGLINSYKLPSLYNINYKLKLAETIPLSSSSCSSSCEPLLEFTNANGDSDDVDDDDDDDSLRYYSTNILSLYLNKHFISQYAFNWTANNNNKNSNKNTDGEVINLLTGLLHNDKIASISKLALFNEYITVIKYLPNINKKLLHNFQLNYGDVKLLAKDYQKSKIIAYKLLADNKLGNWSKKPKEIYDFSLDRKFF